MSTAAATRFYTVLADQYKQLFELPNYALAAAKATPEQAAQVMVNALFAGKADKEGEGVKRTCKALDIKHTYKAIEQFLQDGTNDQHRKNLARPGGTSCGAAGVQKNGGVKMKKSTWTSEITNIEKVGAWNVGTYRGFHVSREVGCRTWQFYICGFSDNDCGVLMRDGTKTRQLIDENNNLTIHGKKFTSKNWNH